MDWTFPHRSQRMPVLADNVVATSQPLATQAGIAMLAQRGNAVDAAVAAAAALTVVEPVMNGLGSDAFAQVWDGRALSALNASGRAPRAWSPERFAGLARMPTEGWDSVTVPGAVSAWIALWKRYGTLPLETLFAPAIRYAQDGYAVSPGIARQWAAQAPRLKSQPGFADTFMPQGRAPTAGERFRLPAAGRTLARIAATEGAAFYEGEIAEALAAHAARHGGALTMEDLAAHKVDWVEPLSLRYRQSEVMELPPNGQGIAVQIALGLLAHFDLRPDAVPLAARMHLQIEAMKIAFADVYRWVTEREAMPLSPSDLLDPGYLAERAHAIDPTRAKTWAARALPGGNTVYIAAADAGGMVVSYIQSNFQGFGSGVVVPEVGVSLLNRGAGFSLAPGHPNIVAGGKRPFHTIIPAMLMRDGRAIGALGVVGADMQPQGQVQIIGHMEDGQLNPQSALDAPRWRVTEEGRVRLESDVPAEVAATLAGWGHEVEVCAPGTPEFGGAQLVWRVNDGVDGGWAAASDPRRDGSAAGF
jgi:gamma-glutamyltranspeptidase/glutathione hydrolase